LLTLLSQQGKQKELAAPLKAYADGDPAWELRERCAERRAKASLNKRPQPGPQHFQVLARAPIIRLRHPRIR